MDVDDLDGGLADTTGDRSVFRGLEPQVVSESMVESGQAVVAWHPAKENTSPSSLFKSEA